MNLFLGGREGRRGKPDVVCQKRATNVTADRAPWLMENPQDLRGCGPGATVRAGTFAVRAAPPWTAIARHRPQWPAMARDGPRQTAAAGARERDNPPPMTSVPPP